MKVLCMLWLLRQGLTLVQQLACSELEAAVTAVAQLGAARFLQMGLAWITPPQDTLQSLAHYNSLPMSLQIIAIIDTLIVCKLEEPAQSRSLRAMWKFPKKYLLVRNFRGHI